jgi:hypothetical protein
MKSILFTTPDFPLQVNSLQLHSSWAASSALSLSLSLALPNPTRDLFLSNQSQEDLLTFLSRFELLDLVGQRIQGAVDRTARLVVVVSGATRLCEALEEHAEVLVVEMRAAVEPDAVVGEVWVGGVELGWRVREGGGVLKLLGGEEVDEGVEGAVHRVLCLFPRDFGFGVLGVGCHVMTTGDGCWCCGGRHFVCWW